MYEDDLEYARRRLDGTVVRLLNGELFQVSETHTAPAGMFHQGYVLETGEYLETPHTNLDLTPLPLGFVNTSGGMVFVGRKPLRSDWRQGTRWQNLFTYGQLGPQELKLKWLSQPVHKKYPSLSTALKALGRKSSIAFSREFGISVVNKVPELIYRKYVVGEFVKGVPILSQSGLCLKQELEEVLEEVA